ncbi:MAG: Phenylacetic acid catabolic protein [Actinomycetota bacterium]
MPRRRWTSPGHFASFLDAGGLVEVDDEMPDPYRRAAFRLVVRHANGELLAALADRDWVAKAPGLRLKMVALARAQDELGHARSLYRVAADLGGGTDGRLLDDLVAGRGRPAEGILRRSGDWAERVVVDHLADSAALAVQRSIATRCSYGPYRRALLAMLPEEEAHVAVGLTRLQRAALGTPRQRLAIQAAVDRRWQPLLASFGPDDAAEDDELQRWRLIAEPNAAVRDRWVAQTVPLLDELGLSTPERDVAVGAEADAEVARLIDEAAGRRQRTAWVRRAMARPADPWVDQVAPVSAGAGAGGRR